MNINTFGLCDISCLQEGSTYNWMGFGTYGKAEELTGFAALFNAKRVYSLPTIESELELISEED